MYAQCEFCSQSHSPAPQHLPEHCTGCTAQPHEPGYPVSQAHLHSTAPYLHVVCWVQIDVLSCDVPMHILILMDVLQAVQLGVNRRDEHIRATQTPSAPCLSLNWSLPSFLQLCREANKGPCLSASNVQLSGFSRSPYPKFLQGDILSKRCYSSLLQAQEMLLRDLNQPPRSALHHL